MNIPARGASDCVSLIVRVNLSLIVEISERIMMKSFLGSGVVLVAAFAGLTPIAFADGSNTPTIHTPAPAPLNVQSYSSSSPTIHYANPTAAGTKIYSSSCANSDNEVCSGTFVSTGRVVLSGEAPAYVESVAPIIHRGQHMTSTPVTQKVVTHSQKLQHQNCNCCANCQHTSHGSQQIHMDGNFTGGVGAGVSSNWGGGHGGFLSVQSPMVRSRNSVMYHPYSSYIPRHRTYRVNKRRG